MRHALSWPRSVGRGDVVALGVFVLCAVLLHKDALFAGRLYAEADTVGYYYPILADFSEELRGGRFPLWSPDVFTGFPLYADGESGLFYPPNLVAMVLLSPVAALVALRLAHTIAAALFAYTYLRLVGAGSLGALVGGLVYAFGSFLVAQMHHGNVLGSGIWLPATLLFVELWWRRTGTVRTLAWLGAAASLAMTALGVHVQVLLMVGGAYTLYVLFRLLYVPRSTGGSGGLRWRTAGVLLVAAPAVAASLAAVQLVPFIELAGSALRGQGASYEYAVSYSLPPVNLVTLLFPYFFRNVGGSWWGLWAPWETTVYLGIAPLLLAVVAVLFVRRRLVVFHCGLGLLAILVAMGDYLPVKLYALIWQVPFLSGLRAPGRYSLLFVFAGAVLAALGTAWLTRQVTGVAGSRRLARFVGVAALAAGALALLVYLGSRYVRDAPEATLAMLDSLYLPRPKSPYQLDLRPGEVLQGLQDALSLVRWETSLSLGLLALSLALLVLWVRFPGGMRVWQVYLVALVAGDLLLFGWNYHPQVEAAELTTPSLLGSFLRGQPGLHRVEVAFEDGSLGGNRLMPLDVARVGGYSSLRLKRAAEYRALMPRFDVLRDLAGVRFVVLPGQPQARKAYADTAFDLDTPLAVLSRQHPGGALSRFRVPGVKADSLRLIAYLEQAVTVRQGTTVAELLVGSDGGQAYVVPVRAGEEVFEWAASREDVKDAMAHRKTQSAVSVPATDHIGRRYQAEIAFAEVDLPASLDVTSIEARYVGAEGRLSILGLGLVARDGGTVFSLAREHMSRYRSVFQSAAARVLENAESLPRAFVVPEGRWVGRLPGALSIMVDESFDPRATVLLEGEGRPEEVAARLSPSTPPAAASSMAGAEVRVERYGPSHISIAAQTPMAGFLVLTDAYYPGWRALVDGVERPILLANYLYRAVPLEAGDHQVEFVYEPVSLRWGLGVTAAAHLLIGLVVVGALRQRSAISYQRSGADGRSGDRHH